MMVIESMRMALLLFLIVLEKIAVGELIVKVNLYHSNRHTVVGDKWIILYYFWRGIN